ncbi:unnamed protein product, partial [Musa acuminata var. zebrina]
MIIFEAPSFNVGVAGDQTNKVDVSGSVHHRATVYSGPPQATAAAEYLRDDHAAAPSTATRGSSRTGEGGAGREQASIDGG